jgi:hypothetical protein
MSGNWRTSLSQILERIAVFEQKKTKHSATLACAEHLQADEN